jgi:hypothetical protein
MYCATPLNLKVCSSTTTAVTAATASCGTYKFIDVVVLTTNTTCTLGQLQLTTASEFELATASPWTLSIGAGSLLAAAIIGVWAIGYAFKLIGRVLDSPPE